MQDVNDLLLAAFADVARLTAAADTPLDDVLRSVGRNLASLLGASRCSVMLRGDDGLYHGRVGYAPEQDIDARVRQILSGVEADGFTREIVRTREPIFIRDARTDLRTVQSSMRRWGIVSILGVPLVVGHEVLGVIFVDNGSRPADFAPWQLKLAKTFASMAAVAVRQRAMYEELESRARTIDRQRHVLSRSNAVHSTVMRRVLDGAGTEATVVEVARLLARTVVLHDPNLRPIAWSGAEGALSSMPACLTHAEAELPALQEALAGFNRETSTIVLPVTPWVGSRRLLSRMVVGGECVGYLEVQELGRPFGPVDARAVEQVSLAIALEILHHARRHHLEDQAREDLLADILSGRLDGHSLRERAARLRVTTEGPKVIVRVQYDRVSEPASDPVSRRARRAEQVAALEPEVAPYLEVVGHTSLPGTDLVLYDVKAADAFDLAELQTRLSACETPLRERGVRFLVLSDVCSAIEELPLETDKVRSVAMLLRRAPKPAFINTVREYGFLSLLARREGIEEVVRFAARKLGPLLEHDERQRKGELVGTLDAYLRSEAQCRLAAAMLGVHENTVRYRLKRIEELAGIELDRLSDLMDAALSLQVFRLYGPKLGQREDVLAGHAF